MNKPLIHGRDIIVVGLQPWDVELGSNCKNLALEFSKWNRVLYVNSPLDRKTYLTRYSDPKVKKRLRVIKGKSPGLNNVAENIWELNSDKIVESINWIQNPWLYDVLNKRNNFKFSNSIKIAIKSLGFKSIILFNDNDMFRSFYLKELLNPAVSIYYSRDFLLAVDYFSRHGKRLEPKLIAKSDLCVANSLFLTNYCKKYNRHSFYVGQGCDLSLFQSETNSQDPEEPVLFSGPVIGYVGALQSIRLDLEIIEHIAVSRPDWSIVLVGPEDDVFKKSQLHNIKNIHFTGAKDLTQLPAYINSFNVCINPQLVNLLTEGNYPRKVDEYLAMGKPVVATRTEAMQIFSDYTYLADTKSQYVELIELALNEDNSELHSARQKFASSHTWENSAQQIYKAILEVSVKLNSEIS